MSRTEVIGYLERYAASFPAPVVAGVTVTRVQRTGALFQVETDHGSFRADAVVVATGQCDRPLVPSVASGLHGGLTQVVPTAYRNPSELPDGGVLVVGASATGIQLAYEIHASGRPVTLAVGRHFRLPRRYRGKDIFWWLEGMGTLGRSTREVRDLEAARAEPSLQLVGTPDHRSLDLGVLRDAGVRLAGRVVDTAGQRVFFADDLADTMRAAEAKLDRQLRRIDAYIREAGLDDVLPAGQPMRALCPQPADTTIHLRDAGIRTVLWATGYRRTYPWLKVPVLDQRKEIRHDGGVTPQDGLYVLGLNFLRRRKSSFIDGVGADARAVAAHIHARSTARRRAVA
jgi:putative flavoprotein involved in K+ transport